MLSARNLSGGAVLVLVGAALGLLLAGRPAPPSADRPNVILILVDTLRADHLGIYGYARRTSPNIDRFFARDVVFESARSQAACTFPSANSLLTSRDTLEFVGIRDDAFGIPEGYRSIAEILHAAGYRTIAVSASPIVRKSPSVYNEVGGFERGFDVFDEICQWRQARCVNDRALRHLGVRSLRPVFLYLHYMDPHDPYQPPKSFEKRFSRAYAGYSFIAEGDPNPIVAAVYGWMKKFPLSHPPVDPEELKRDDLDHLVDLYDDEIAYFDSELGGFLTELDRRGVLDEAVVALVSDHGEQFLEHGHVKHCLGSVHEEAIHTPFLLHVSGAHTGVRVKLPVANLDLVPTLLDYAGVSGNGADFRGRSLRALVTPAVTGVPFPDPRYIFSVQGDFYSATDGHYKYMVDIESKERFLYDLASDPGEEQNLVVERGEEVGRLSGVLGTWVRRVSGHQSTAKRLRMADAVEERLRAIGYLP